MELISCTLPTRGRQRWATQAVACFLSQTYENKELIILDDQRDPSFPKGNNGFPSNVIYISHTEPWNIAQKRNRIVKYAGGQILCHFDSDDWSDVSRLESQINFMNETKKAIVGFKSIWFVNEETHQVWKYVGRWAVGTSLMYTRQYWMTHPFPEQKQTGSDSVFIQAADKTKDTAAVDAGELMVARIHSENSSRKPTDHRINYRPANWNQLPVKFLSCLQSN
jgi:glycosyltransferase involved in cell wall biosynthesis